MEFKKITRLVVFLCLFSAVLSINVQHGKHARLKKSTEMEEAVMHPKKIYQRASTSPKESPRKGASAADDDADIGEISQMLNDEFMRRMELDDSKMHDPPKKSTEMEEAVRHPKKIYKRASTPPKESPRKGASAADDDADIGEISQMLDDEFMRRMELDDSEMHDPPKIKKTARPLEGMDLDGMHPIRPGVAGVQAKDAKSVDDPVIRDSDLFSVLGQDILQQFDFDDSAMHPREVAKQPSRSSSSKSRAPEMDERVMHPHVTIKEQQKDIPAIEPSKEEDPDISTELGEDFMQQFELDDSLMHPADARVEWKKSSYYNGRDKTAGLQMHPKAAPHQQQGAEDVVKDDDVDDEIDADELGHDFMQRKEVDGSGMHDPNWQHREDPEKFQRIRRSNSRRLDRGLGFPLHASCGLNWVFGMNCSSVSKALEQQIAKWSTKDNCDGGGEKCLYKLVSSNATTLLATHETPENHYFDDLSFQFTKGSETCKVYGFSTSETWYAVLDKGTNYCNLHNLITGSGLNNTPGYKETTTDNICTQFSSADCDVY